MSRIESKILELKMLEIFDRTKRNCRSYEKEGKEIGLINEIGCLVGVAYCLQAAGFNPTEDTEFLRLINIQQELKAKDNN